MDVRQLQSHPPAGFPNQGVYLESMPTLLERHPGTGPGIPYRISQLLSRGQIVPLLR